MSNIEELQTELNNLRLESAYLHAFSDAVMFGLGIIKVTPDGHAKHVPYEEIQEQDGFIK